MLEYDLELPLEEIGPKFWEALAAWRRLEWEIPSRSSWRAGVRSLAPARVLKGKHLKLKFARQM